MAERVLVSSCLLGIHCRYDGGHRFNERLLASLKKEVLIPVCPEQIGGLPTPRPAAEIGNGDGGDVLEGRSAIVDENGEEVTGHLLRGAEDVLMLAKGMKIKRAIMKERSPSCGVRKIYRKGVLVPGRGILTALLQREGIDVLSSEEM